MTIEDETGTISVTVPTAWADIDGSSTDLGDGIGVAVGDRLTEHRRFPSVMDDTGNGIPRQPHASRQFRAGELLGLIAPTDCITQGRNPYDDGFFVGEFEVFTDCGGSDTQYYAVASTSIDGAYGVVVAVQVVSDADLEALDNILGSFNVTV